MVVLRRFRQHVRADRVGEQALLVVRVAVGERRRLRKSSTPSGMLAGAQRAAARRHANLTFKASRASGFHDAEVTSPVRTPRIYLISGNMPLCSRDTPGAPRPTRERHHKQRPRS